MKFPPSFLNPPYFPSFPSPIFIAPRILILYSFLTSKSCMLWIIIFAGNIFSVDFSISKKLNIYLFLVFVQSFISFPYNYFCIRLIQNLGQFNRCGSRFAMHHELCKVVVKRWQNYLPVWLLKRWVYRGQGVAPDGINIRHARFISKI